MKSKPL